MKGEYGRNEEIDIKICLKKETKTEGVSKKLSRS